MYSRRIMCQLGWVLIVMLVYFGSPILAQEATESVEPTTAVSTGTPTLTPSFTPVPTHTETATVQSPSATTTFTPLPPTATASPTETATVTLSPSVTPEVETTEEVEVTEEVPSPTATETATVIPTASTTPLPLPNVPWTLAFTDTFDQINGSAWLFAGSGWGYVPQPEGGQALQVFHSTSSVTYTGEPMMDMAVAVDVQVAHGTAYLYARHSGALTYAAWLAPNWEVGLSRAGTPVTVANLPGFSADMTHQLRLNVYNATIWVEVDGLPVIQMQDAVPLPPGTVGMSAVFPAITGDITPVPPEYTVVFDNLYLYQPANQVVPPTSTSTATATATVLQPTAYPTTTPQGLLPGQSLMPRAMAQASSMATTVSVPNNDTAQLITEMNNAYGQEVVIELAPDGYYPVSEGPYWLFGGTALPIVQDGTHITINGNGATISAENVWFRIFAVGEYSTLILRDLTIENALLGENGGAGVLVVGGTLEVDNVRFLYNTVSNSPGVGGAISSYFGNLSITNSYFEGNHAEYNGGAMVINGNYLNTIVLSNNVFAYNSALNGGAIYYDFDGVFPTITGNTYQDNYVVENGGALFIAYGGVTETGSAFHSNIAYGEGGAIYSTSDAPSQITDGEIMGNSSPMVVAIGSGVLNVGRNMWDDIGGPAPGDVVGNVEFGGSQCEMTGDDLDGDCLANDFESLIPGLSPEMLDSDGDGIYDGDEDYDTDRLSNLAEQENGTDPTSWDTDRDDLSDGSEILDYGSDPHIADTDGDELPDGFEVYLSHTSPTLMDTDGDGIDDGATDQDGDGLTTLEEFIWESYPLAPDSNSNGILDGDEDADGDGLTIAQELQCSTTPWDWYYDPTRFDTDGNLVGDGDEDYDHDGLSNVQELALRDGENQPVYNFILEDTDGNGVWDGDEDYDSDRLTNAQEANLRDGVTPDGGELIFDLALVDTDGNGIWDGDEDLDGDGLTTYEELVGDSWWEIYYPTQFDTDGNGVSDGDEDVDTDRLTNLQELRWLDGGGQPLYDYSRSDTDGNGVSDGDEDYDGDGLTNTQEFNLKDTMGQHLYDPAVADTDGNGVADGDEDYDGDGLTNVQELLANALAGMLVYDPITVDTDSNGVNDGDEDIDADGLTNLQELHWLNGGGQPLYDYLYWDSDSNGIADGDEDYDIDGLTNAQEFSLTDAMGQQLYDPAVADSDANGTVDGDEDYDGDGLTNQQELSVPETGVYDPTIADTDINGVNDGDEDYDADGLTNIFEVTLLDATQQPVYDFTQIDTDGNGVNDGDEDYDVDGLTNVQELGVNALAGETVYDPAVLDTDGNGTADGDEDYDTDGLTNVQELYVNAFAGIVVYDFVVADTDSDGVNDGEEDYDADGLTNVFEVMLLDASQQPVYDFTRIDTDDNDVTDGDEDYDADGLTNVQELTVNVLAGETVYDPALLDTDGNGANDGDEDYDADGLTNVQELYVNAFAGVTVYDFVVTDTDDNGITDGDEDYDTDGLTNVQELHVNAVAGVAVYDFVVTDTDGNGINDGDEDYDTDGLTNIFEVTLLDAMQQPVYDFTRIDTDDNGVNDGDEDYDADGLTNVQELAVNALAGETVYDPAVADTDDNGIADGDEDYDTDGLTNIFEVTLLDGTQQPVYDFTLTDTDDNGITDGDEDYDTDGLTNVQELAVNALAGETIYDPAVLDTNGNGVTDGDEDYDVDGLTNVQELYVNAFAGTVVYDFTLTDTDDNGIADGDEDYDTDGLTNVFEVTLLDGTQQPVYDFTRIDTDGNSITDGDEDYDTDGLTNVQELAVNALAGETVYDPAVLDTDGNDVTDGDEDYDTDGLTNVEELNLRDGAGEIVYDFTLADTDNNGVIDGDEDPDADDLLNWEEFLYGADPFNPDTDSDTLPDGFEVKLSHTDPTVPDDTSADPDGDGLTNYQEYLLGTDPLESTTLGEPARLRSTTTLQPQQATANGQSPIVITTIVRDLQGHFLPDTPVTYQTTNPNLVITPLATATDELGTIQAEVVSSVVTSGSIDVLADGIVVGRPLVQFVGGDPAVRITAHSTSNILPGQIVHTVFTVTNDGQLPIQNIEVMGTIPLGYGRIETGEALDVDVVLRGQGQNSISWSIPALAVGEQRIFHLRFRAGAQLQPNDQVALTVQISASEDTGAGNNTTTFSARIVKNLPLPSGSSQAEKLAVAVTSSLDQAAIGQPVELIVTVENLSAEPIYNLVGFAPMLSSSYPNLNFTWADPTRLGYLAPAGSGETSRAVAHFDFTLPTNYPNGVNRTVTVQALDGDPTDGSTVVTSDSLTDAELGVRGPNLLAQLTADYTTAAPGTQVTFTLTVSNAATSNDTATNLMVSGNFLPGPTALESLAPGASTSLQFTRTVVEADSPRVTAMVQLTGQGETNTDVMISQSRWLTVRVPGTNVVPEPTQPIADLTFSPVTTAPAFLPDHLTQLSLTVRNQGTADAQDVSLRLSVPFDLEVDSASLNGGVFDETARVITWTYTTLAASAGQAVSPIFYVPADAVIDTVVVLDAAVATTSDEPTLENNLLSLEDVIARPGPTQATLQPVERNWLVADEQDVLTLELAVFDQLGQPLPEVQAILTTSVSGLSLDPSTVTTDATGHATLAVQATEVGVVDVMAAFTNGYTVSTTLNRRDNAVRITRSPSAVGIGGTDYYQVFVVNTATLSDGTTASSDLVDLSLTLPSELSADWFTFAQPTLPLGFGEFMETRLTVTLPPAEDLPDCQALVGTHPFTVTATGQILGVVGQVDGELTITAQPPELENVYPREGERIGGDQALFGWRSNTPATSTVYYRRQGETDFTTLTMQSADDDPQLYLAFLDVSADAYGTVFEWYALVSNGCSTRVLGSPTQPRTFTRVQTTTFVDSGYDFTVADGYDLTTSTGGAPLAIRVRNDDMQAHTVQVDVENPYDDLILGFVDSGSVDQVVTLAIGQTFATTLHVFTQETTREVYSLTLRLENDLGEVDRVPLTIRVRQPVFDIGINLLEIEPRTLVTRARLTNNGDTLTDLTLDVVQDATGLPANMVIQPDIRHTYLKAGQTIEIAFIPLAVQDTTTLLSEPTYDPLTGTILADSQSEPTLLAVTGPYRITAAARNMVLDNVIPTGGDLVDTCGANESPQTVAAQCTVPSGTQTRTVSGWYCTNKPDIDVPFQLGLPNGGMGLPLTRVEVGANFSTGFTGETVYNHSTTISLNGSVVTSGIVPQQTHLTGEVSPAVLNLGGISPQQTLNLRSEHTNNAHYTVTSGFTIQVDYDSYTRTGCFTPEEVEAAAGGTLACSGHPLFDIPDTPQLALDLSLAEPDKSDALVVGDHVSVIARITNRGGVNTVAPVVLTLNVPEGLAPVGVTVDVQSGFVSILNFVRDLMKSIILNLGEKKDLTLSPAGDSVDISYSYTLEPLNALETKTFEFTLEVLAEQSGIFTIQGTASTELEPPPTVQQTSLLFLGSNTMLQQATSLNEVYDGVVVSIGQCEVNTWLGGPWNVRALPSMSSAAIGTIGGNVTITLIGWHTSDEGDTFYLLGEDRWISDQAVSAEHCRNLVYYDDNGDPFPLQVSKSIEPGIPQSSDDITYTITVENKGAEAFSSVSVEDILPDAFHTDLTTQWDIEELEPDGEVVFTVSGDIGSAAVGQPLINTVQILASPDHNIPVTLEASVNVYPATCVQTVSQPFILYKERSTGAEELAEITADTQIGVIGTFVDDATWQRITVVVDGESLIGWITGLPEEANCASDTIVDADGKVIFVPSYDPATQCLAKLTNDEAVYTIEQIRNLTNPNPTEETPIITRAAQSYAVVTAIHPNRQYVQIRYGVLNSQGEEVLLEEDDHWIKVRSYTDPNYPGLTIIDDGSCLDTAGNFSRERIELLADRISDTDLPDCREDKEDFVNCQPSYPHPFPELWLTEFGDPYDGADEEHNGACGAQAWRDDPDNLNLHCGDDLVRRNDAERNDESDRNVYVIQGGIYREFGGLPPDSFGTCKIRVRADNTLVHEYQYTHVQKDPLLARGYRPDGEYIAAGILLGQYTNTPPNSGLTLHVHMAIKTFPIGENDENLYGANAKVSDATYISVEPGSHFYVPWINNVCSADSRCFNPRFTEKSNRTGDEISLDVHARERTKEDGTSTVNTYEADNLPPGLNIDSATGVISGKIEEDAAGDYEVKVTATDDRGRTGDIYFVWTVEERGE